MKNNKLKLIVFFHWMINRLYSSLSNFYAHHLTRQSDNNYQLAVRWELKRGQLWKCRIIWIRVEVNGLISSWMQWFSKKRISCGKKKPVSSVIGLIWNGNYTFYFAKIDLIQTLATSYYFEIKRNHFFVSCITKMSCLNPFKVKIHILANIWCFLQVINLIWL